MRQLILLRGAPGSGKSTFIQNAGLEAYTLNADDIRLLFQGPVMNLDGEFGIPQDNDSHVWNFLYDRLEERMARGELVVVDAMHAHPKSFGKYNDLRTKYRYRVTVVDFWSWIDADTCKLRNRERQPEFKRVPDGIIDRAYDRFAASSPPGWCNVVTPVEFADQFTYTPTDVSNYKKIVFIGDIQGCWDPLERYFEEHPLSEDNLYVYVGDLLDRGPQNGEVMKFMLTQVGRKNVVIVEGNHERWIRKWAAGEEVFSDEFVNFTQPQLEAAGITKKDAKELCRHLQQIHYLDFHGQKVLVSHAGIPKMPENLLLIHAHQFIKGVGKYEDDIDALWEANEGLKSEIVQVHGHRNEFLHPHNGCHPHSINLEGQVEFGGCLRIAELTYHPEDEDAFMWTLLEGHNDHVDARFLPPPYEDLEGLPLIEQLRKSPLVNEKKYGNIVSFSFAKEAYYGKLWDTQVIKARGLFINEVTGKIVSRSYNKFFNVGEREETRLDNLADTLQFPVTVYDKPNGYLGIVGYDEETDEIVISSKSTPEGKFADWFKEILSEKLDEAGWACLKDVLKTQNLAATFEVIDPIRDPHVITYPQRTVILLDLVERTDIYSKRPYAAVVGLADALGLEVKEWVEEFADWGSFKTWHDEVMAGWDPQREGYVVEDSVGFMTKLKLPYYTFWKQVRGIVEGMARKGPMYMLPIHCQTTRHLQVYDWLKTLDPKQLEQDVITLRQQFEAEVTVLQ